MFTTSNARWPHQIQLPIYRFHMLKITIDPSGQEIQDEKTIEITSRSVFMTTALK